jgi:hypothetical protein
MTWYRLYKGVLYIVNHMVSQDMQKYNFSYAFEKSMTFPAPVITKFIVAEQHYMEIFWTKFYPNMQ